MEKNIAWVEYVCQSLEKQFSQLKPSNYQLISPDTAMYNCVAWAAEDTDKWWWPDSDNIHYWPPNVTREETLEAFIELFQKMGYEICEDESGEIGFQKIAIYIDINNMPTHVARQINNGKWTSKIGQNEVIEHDILAVLTGDEPAYGTVGCLLKKRLDS